MSKKIKSKKGRSKTKQSYKGICTTRRLQMNQNHNLFYPNISEYVTGYQTGVNTVEMPLNRSMRRHMKKTNKEV